MQKIDECPASYLPSHIRNKLIKIAVEEGYAVKDLAEVMGVSPAAVSRYLHGTLSPSIESTCRLIFSIDEHLRHKILEEIALELLDVVESIVEHLGASDRVHMKLEAIADKISSIMLKTVSLRARARKTI